MKKIITALICSIAAITMAFAFAACSGGQTGDNGDNTQGSTQSPDGRIPDAEEPAEWGNVLVVYFSAQGHTENVANYIAEATGGTLFELVPADPYTSDDLRWTNEDSRVVQEYQQKQAGTLETVELEDVTVDGWENYDTVFLGFPIWWYEAAWPVYDFVISNDFTGKTIYTFCTSSSSSLGDSTQVLADMAGGEGIWLDGRRFSSSASEATVESWIESLN